MAWVCKAGGTLLIPSGPGYHLFVILNSPADFPTYPPQMERSAVLADRVASGTQIAREPVNEALRLDLIAGLYASSLTPRYLKYLTIT